MNTVCACVREWTFPGIGQVHSFQDPSPWTLEAGVTGKVVHSHHKLKRVKKRKKMKKMKKMKKKYRLLVVYINIIYILKAP